MKRACVCNEAERKTKRWGQVRSVACVACCGGHAGIYWGTEVYDAQAGSAEDEPEAAEACVCGVNGRGRTFGQRRVLPTLCAQPNPAPHELRTFFPHCLAGAASAPLRARQASVRATARRKRVVAIILWAL